MTRKNKEPIDAELEKLYAQGKLTKAGVVKAAENPKSPLHKVIFSCSDTKAAYEHRLTKAGELIREFESRFIVQEVEISVPKWVHTKISPGYVHINAVKNNRTVSKEFMRNELTMARALVERCYKFALVLGFDGRLDKILVEMDSMLSAITSRASNRNDSKRRK